jgi:hypothetical protein
MRFKTAILCSIFYFFMPSFSWAQIKAPIGWTLKEENLNKQFFSNDGTAIIIFSPAKYYPETQVEKSVYKKILRNAVFSVPRFVRDCPGMQEVPVETLFSEKLYAITAP